MIQSPIRAEVGPVFSNEMPHLPGKINIAGRWISNLVKFSWESVEIVNGFRIGVACDEGTSGEPVGRDHQNGSWPRHQAGQCAERAGSVSSLDRIEGHSVS